MKWRTIQHDTGEHTKAMEVPGGVLVKHEQWQDYASESMVFVPKVKLEPDDIDGDWEIVPC